MVLKRREALEVVNKVLIRNLSKKGSLHKYVAKKARST